MWRGLLFVACVLFLVNPSIGGLLFGGDAWSRPLRRSVDLSDRRNAVKPSLLDFRSGGIRLVGGKEPNEGRVEINVNGVWGTVCDDNWDIREAKVVCRMLNFPSARRAVFGGVYGAGKGPIYMDNVNCLGFETDLAKCQSSGLGISDCKHVEDAGVVCTQEKNNSRVHVVEHSRGLSAHLGSMFATGRDCDMTLSVVVQSNTVETICAHKLILSLQFMGSFPFETNMSIEVSPECQPHVVHFVRYLYTGQINIVFASAHCIHMMASEWGLKALQEEAGNLLNWMFPDDPTFHNLSSLFDYAVRINDSNLERSCLRYMAWNCEALVASVTWTSLSVGAIKGLLARTDLTVPSEYFVLRAVERWEKAQEGYTSGLGDRFDLLKHIRFPMIPAKELAQLQDPRYQAGKLQGFQFNAMGKPNDEDMSQWESFTPRIYTEEPWGFTFTSQEVSNYMLTGVYSTATELEHRFSTPVHNSAYFVLFGEMRWYTQLYVREEECARRGRRVCPSVVLMSENSKRALPKDLKDSIVYENKVIMRCDGRYVTHIEDLDPLEEETMMPPTGHDYPCQSDLYSYTMVIRPKYHTGE